VAKPVVEDPFVLVSIGETVETFAIFTSANPIALKHISRDHLQHPIPVLQIVEEVTLISVAVIVLVLTLAVSLEFIKL
jgi:hypothetical protein